ncbi:MAG: acetyltransferase [Methylobacteriaceae bacterium]|nr:acetyltransferase [Methylobacteriaceae bacterium]
MGGVILFGVSSPIVVDFEESLRRAGIPLIAGIRNRPEPSDLSPDVRILSPEELAAGLLDIPFLVPLFAPGHRYQATQEARRHGLWQPFTLIDASVVAPRRLEVGAGTFINTGCTLGGASTFGSFVFINRGANIGHHAKFGDFVSIGPGVSIAGKVTVGTGCVVATGASILPSISLGANCVVGAGAVVTRDVPDGCLVVGNPARIVRRNIGGYKGLIVVA